MSSRSGGRGSEGIDLKFTSSAWVTPGAAAAVSAAAIRAATRASGARRAGWRGLMARLNRDMERAAIAELDQAEDGRVLAVGFGPGTGRRGARAATPAGTSRRHRSP